jgi:hypothetical protein
MYFPFIYFSLQIVEKLPLFLLLLYAAVEQAREV